jgi:hypothetical protein
VSPRHLCRLRQLDRAAAATADNSDCFENVFQDKAVL